MSMSMPVPAPMHTAGGWRSRVQRFGGFLAAMVIPNIGAFLAWGLITAFFIPTGWIPNEDLAQLVDPMIFFLLPILIGYTGGYLIHGQRGAVLGAILAILAYWVIGPPVAVLSSVAGDAVDFLVDNTLLPLTSIIVEPAKVLFLNNAINHGVLAPLGVAEAADEGKSILFMIETNPGPGLGLLLAYWFFGPPSLRPTAPGAIIIHFFGGIHEIYFPYVLMRPILILGMIAGGMAGVFTFLATGAGLTATPSPGSIFAYFAVTPKGGHFGMLAGVAVAAAVSFAVNALILKATVREEDEVVIPDTVTTGSAPATA